MKFIRLFLLLVVHTVFSQEPLTLDQAVSQALQNNFGIRIARNDAVIDENNASWGNAGLLPQLTAAASTTHSVNNSKQTYVTGNIIDRTNAVSDAKNLGVNLNWTLFDGLAMFANLQKLRAYRDMGELAARQAVEEALSQVIIAYVDIVQQKQKQRSLQEATAISEQRLKLSEAKYRMGAESKFDLLSARVDLNQDRSGLLSQEAVLNRAKTLLNELLGRDVNAVFDVADSISFRERLTLPNLRASLLQNNAELLWHRKNLRASALETAATWGPRLPRVGVTAGYTITRSESQSGMVLTNKTHGFSYGLNASYTLFDGFNIHRKWQNARITERGNELRIADRQNQLEADLVRVFQQYTTNLTLIEMETENVGVARENVTVSIEKYRLGSITALQMRDIQIKYLDALGRLISAQYLAKSAETELLTLSGGLIKDI